MSLKIGSLLDDRYRIESRAGSGGMAEVYEATDLFSKKIVAIKIIKEEVMKNSANIQRFSNEAMIAASLNHPNIVKVYNHGITDSRPYIVNEFIKGQTLKDVLDFKGSLMIEEALDAMIQLSSALAYSHAHGIIHRDVKPENIYLLPDGTVKLGDFGIAQVEGIDSTLTNTTEIIGSVYYLAPEISKGQPASAQSDIYAAGVTFFEMLTGHVPFMSDHAVNIAVAHINSKFPSPRKYLPKCPKEIESIIFRCCEKLPKNRYENATDLYDDLKLIKDNPSLYKEKKSLIARIFGFK